MRRYAPALPICLLPLLACDAGAPGRTAAPADSAAGEVALETAGPNDAALLVPVRINGEGPYDFVLDSGATLTCVDAELASDLALPERGGPGGVGVGFERAARVPLVLIDSMRIGAAEAFDLPACVLDLAHFRRLGVEAHGLVGLNFLREFRVTLDFERDVLILQE